MEKVIYKAPNAPGQRMPDVFIMTEPGMASKYRAQKCHQGPLGSHGKESDSNEPQLALVDVVQTFDIFQTTTGKGFEGNVARPAKSDLAAIFDTENEQAIVEKILLEGEIQGAR